MKGNRWRPLVLVGLLLCAGGCFWDFRRNGPSDREITSDLTAAIKNRPELGVQYLDIDTHDGVVTLSGIVGSEETRYELVRLARHEKGVRQVIANIAVRSQGLTKE